MGTGFEFGGEKPAPQTEKVMIEYENKKKRSKNVMIHPPRYTNKRYFDEMQIRQSFQLRVECIDLYDYLDRFGIENVRNGGIKINPNALIQIILEFAQDELMLRPKGFRDAEEIIEELKQLTSRK